MACRMAADELSERENGNPREAHLYDPFRALLEGYALAGSALGYLRPKDYNQFTVAGVRAAWQSVPFVQQGGDR